MRLRRLAALAAVLLSIAGSAPANALFNGPPAITVFPDDYPVDVSFFFPAGGPLERFTGRPGAWYAIYRTPMYPGRPYDLILEHKGDPGRMKLFALDNHPFDIVSVKTEAFAAGDQQLGRFIGFRICRDDHAAPRCVRLWDLSPDGMDAASRAGQPPSGFDAAPFLGSSTATGAGTHLVVPFGGQKREKSPSESERQSL